MTSSSQSKVPAGMTAEEVKNHVFSIIKTDESGMPDFRFWYDAALDRVIDGDTIILKVDHGDYIIHTKQIRLLEVDTFELHDKDPDKRIKALEAKEFVRGALSWATEIRIHTQKDKDDKYGRLLAYVWYYISEQQRWHYLIGELVEKGLTEHKEKEKKE